MGIFLKIYKYIVFKLYYAMATAGKHVCSICMLTNVYTCMFTFLQSKTYVNTRFHFCPTARKVSQVDREKCNPPAVAVFSFHPRSFFTRLGVGRALLPLRQPLYCILVFVIAKHGAESP